MIFAYFYSIEWPDAVQWASHRQLGNDNNSIYLVSEDVTINGRITVKKRDADNWSGLIIYDGCTLTASKGISIEEGAVLQINSQADGTGRLLIDNVDANYAVIRVPCSSAKAVGFFQTDFYLNRKER